MGGESTIFKENPWEEASFVFSFLSMSLFKDTGKEVEMRRGIKVGKEESCVSSRLQNNQKASGSTLSNFSNFIKRHKLLQATVQKIAIRLLLVGKSVHVHIYTISDSAI